MAKGLGVTESLETLLLAGNPLGDLGARRLVEGITTQKQATKLKVFDMHNCELSEEVERAVVEKLKGSSQLYLLGSHYGRSDHRLNNLDKDMNPKINMPVGGTPASPIKSGREEVQASMRGHEVF